MPGFVIPKLNRSTGGTVRGSSTRSIPTDNCRLASALLIRALARSGWDLRPITHADPVKTYSFTLTGTGLYNGTATLVWNRRDGQTLINDLNLSLLKDGAPIAASVSQVDNVEHLFVQRLEPGTYDLKVERMNNVVEGAEDYAVAFNFTPVQLISAVSRKTHGDAGAIDIELPLTGRQAWNAGPVPTRLS